MKYFLLTYKILDNGHEHYQYLTTNALGIELATVKGQTQEHEMVEPSMDEAEELTMFDFGDGSTIAKLHNVTEIKHKEAVVLDKLGVAHFYEL